MNQENVLPSELKFIVSREAAASIRDWARTELEADPHSVGADGYRTTSLYFDTDNFDTFYGRSRSKYRIRRYNESPVVFLERKLKSDGRVAKRRSEVSLAGLQIARETQQEQWFWRRLQNRRLRPVCQVAYERMARIGVGPAGTLRLTIDEHVTASPAGSIAFTDVECAEVLPGQAILEMKCRLPIPLLFQRLMEEFGLQPRSVSKYRLAIVTLGLDGKNGRNVPGRSPLVMVR